MRIFLASLLNTIKVNAMKYIFFFVLFVTLILSACQSVNLPTSEGDEKTDITSEPESLTEPLPAILQIGELEQESGITGYCWTVPGEDHGICADGIGFTTPSEPLVVTSPFVARFINPLSTPLDSLMLSVRTLAPEDKLPEEPGGMYYWRPNSTDQITKNPVPPNYEVELSLEPGLYLFNYFAKWEEFGDVSYGFLVEILTGDG